MTITAPEFQMKFGLLRAKAQHFLFLCSAEALCSGKHPDRFGKIGFALCIIAVDHIDTRTRVELDLFHVAELFQFDSGDIHSALPFPLS